MRFWYKSLLFWIIKISGLFYDTPVNLNYWWDFGVLSLYFLLSQIVTGIVLAMFYNPNSVLAFTIIMDLNNEVYYGWWIRYVHANGASFFFFLFIYICFVIYIMDLFYILDNYYELVVWLFLF